MTAPMNRTVDQFTGAKSGVPALLKVYDDISDSLGELKVVELERDNALYELEKAHDEIARLTGLLAAWSDEKRNQGFRAADKARKRVGR